MSRHCYTFDTPNGQISMQFARAMSKTELEDAQPLADRLTAAVPPMDPATAERQDAARARNIARLDRIGLAFPAQYPGTCASCHSPIAVDERIQRTGTRYAHIDCPDPTALRTTETVCPTCFLVKPCECDS